MTDSIFVFPGQGSQAVGMGRDFYDAFPQARHVFEEVDHALDKNLTKIIFEGPEDTLTLTENTQPALMAVSLAIMRVLESQGILNPADAVCMAGHSLGEYSALTAAGVLELADTAQLLKIRGQSMQAAVPVGEGAMAAIIGLDAGIVAEIAEKATHGDVCTLANDNAPGQIVISGHKEAIDRACLIAKEKGAKRALILPVSAPFHCPLMKPAADKMAEALSKVDFKTPVVPIICNVTAAWETDPEQLRDNLITQVGGQVRWRESMTGLRTKGVKKMIEIGAGKVLTGLMKRIDPDIETITINTPQDIDAFLKEAA